MPVIRDVLKNENGEEVSVYIEVDEQALPIVGEGAPGAGLRNPYPDVRGIPQQIGTAFTSAMELVRTCAEQTARTLQSMAPEMRPRACEIQFGVKVDAELGAFIGKTSTEAQLQVTLKWGEETN